MLFIIGLIEVVVLDEGVLGVFGPVGLVVGLFADVMAWEFIYDFTEFQEFTL